MPTAAQTAPVVSLVDIATYFPEKRVPASHYEKYAVSDKAQSNPALQPPPFRRHSPVDESNVDMIERAAEVLAMRHGVNVLADVDVLLTHSQLVDLPFVGAGGEVAHRLGMSPEYILDVHTGGCAAFVLLMKVARQLLVSGAGRTALIATANNSAGKLFDQDQVRKFAHAAAAGDAAAVGLLTLSGESPILDIECRHYGEHAGQMKVGFESPRLWWQSGPGQGYLDFNPAQVFANGCQEVLDVISAVCGRAGIESQDLALLVTSQPNPLFLRSWDDALGIPRQRHRDTFDEYGNLFAPAIPVNLDAAINDGQVQPGDVVMMAGFGHAGDFAAAAALRWGGRPT
ncbi:3-oxoacyl-ACP synthase [Mycobacterium sp. 852002-40037_SCH5390672]|nr:3-oxoacyl-ACP synthase [Mycobacterium sp. 852002-40037_SCH5390672]